IRSAQHEQQEAEAHHAEHAHHPAGETRRQVAAEARHRQRPQGEYPAPQQQRSFVRTPHRRDAIEGWQCGVRIVGDVFDREVEADESMDEHADRSAHQHELAGDRRPDHTHVPVIAEMWAEQAEKRLRRRHQQRQHQCELAEFGEHQVPALTLGGGGLSLSAFATSGGMYFSSCLARISSATNTLPCMRPCATTPCPSRNRSGRMPEYFTSTVCLKSVTRNWMSSVPGVFCRLPFATMPPIRKRLSAGASPAAICVGSKNSMMLPLKAFVPSQAARPTPMTIPATISMRFCRAIMRVPPASSSPGAAARPCGRSTASSAP